jgi:hypothetical protein
MTVLEAEQYINFMPSVFTSANQNVEMLYFIFQ